MSTVYVALLRGINVGGGNRVPMADLRTCLAEIGCTNVQTYIASGNVIFESTKSAAILTREIGELLPTKFALNSKVLTLLILTRDQLQKVVDDAPKGFGTEPDKYYTDVIFLVGIDPKEAFAVFEPREGVDKVWPGDLAIYSQRLGAERTKSKLSKIMLSPLYKRMTIRTWNTTTKLLALMKAVKT